MTRRWWNARQAEQEKSNRKRRKQVRKQEKGDTKETNKQRRRDGHHNNNDDHFDNVNHDDDGGSEDNTVKGATGKEDTQCIHEANPRYKGKKGRTEMAVFCNAVFVVLASMNLIILHVRPQGTAARRQASHVFITFWKLSTSTTTLLTTAT
jgi:hypothetical protein